MDSSVRISGLIHISSEVVAGQNYEGQGVVQMKFHYPTSSKTNSSSTIVVDRATAARLINQLRRALDEDYNRAINERPETDASKDYA